MGYCTRYELSWNPQACRTEQNNCAHDVPVKAKFCPQCGVAVGIRGLNDIVADYIKAQEFWGTTSNGGCDEAHKWYEHEVDMAKLSIAVPDVLFRLSGEGEESGDIWDKYFLNGKMQICNATVVKEPFNAAKLTKVKL
jgi:hypothetical protein